MIGVTTGVAASNNSQLITGCINKSSGALRIVSKCSKSELKIQWNQRGEVGPQGIQGIQGSQGEKGLTGEQGSPGEKGEKGEQGVAGMGLAGPQGPAGANGAQGASGQQGPAGQQLVVRDSNGALVGYLISTLNIGADVDPLIMPASNFYENSVQVWDPIREAKFIYDYTGRPLTSYVLFSGAGCTGTAYSAFSDSIVGQFATLPKYIAFSDSPTGTVRWYEPATTRFVGGTISIASASHYANNCQAGSEFGDSSFTGDIPHVLLNPITAPIPTITGPLRISLN